MSYGHIKAGGTTYPPVSLSQLWVSSPKVRTAAISATANMFSIPVAYAHVIRGQ